jgi:hydrogenase maturation protein HypF
MKINTEKLTLKRILISGIVQGVGFRPFIHRLAMEMGLSGFVRNIGGGVEVIVQADDDSIEKFVESIKESPPQGSRIDNIVVEDAGDEVINNGVFKVVSSTVSERTSKVIPPDISVCDDCLDELKDRANRRYHYPFTSCTYCGPRFTVIDDLPYDRERTTMGEFALCSRCSDEYNNTCDRRFFAQTTGCPDCGPKVSMITKSVVLKGVLAIDRSRKIITDGGVVAIKGLGGYCLSCDANNESAVKRIKNFKLRGDKPMAVMVRNIEIARMIGEVSKKVKVILTSPSAPIVVLPIKGQIPELKNLYANVSHNVGGIGTMLPNTPVHHLLLEGVDFPVVMTSANICDNPIIIDDDEAVMLVNHFDGVLTNNRRISARADDPLIITDGEISVISRTGRGLSPITLITEIDSPDIIALGSDIKNTFSFMKDGMIYQSQHIGDLESSETFEFYKSEIERQSKIYGIKNPKPVCDLSPVYYSSEYSKTLGESIKVQHHYAHLLSVLAEEKIVEGRFLGLSADGTGYGTDGAVWGCEVMAFDISSFKRIAHLEYTPMPGGSSSIRNPYRMAYAYLRTHLEQDELERGCIKSFIDTIDKEERSMLEFSMKDRMLSPYTSSLGRLFDGVSAFLGLCRVSSYEAQPAMELEGIIEKTELSPYQYSILKRDGLLNIGIGEIFLGIAKDVDKGLPACEVSYRFHITIADVLSDILISEEENGYDAIVLSGGCFQNMLLMRLILEHLSSKGLTVLYNKNTPVNDANISIGQALYGGYRYRRKR